MRIKKRTETDSLGSVKIDKFRLWGAQTQRSFENFKIGDEKIPTEIIVALGKQKKSAAKGIQLFSFCSYYLQRYI